MGMLPKDKKLTVMLDEEETAMLAELAQGTGVGLSQTVRTMIREKHAEKHGRSGGRKKSGSGA